ncbi:MAG: hypothetical protein JW958_07230 [Candidatus Eisenbacteria bacterium]|nr:hypothetical protein [Candidatus Eisenbacteria bacterium]
MAVQAESFHGDGPGLATSFGAGDDRFVVRHAALSLEGSCGTRWEYVIEAGTATCAGGTSFQLMEAGAFYRFDEHLRAGMMKGHILRGFALHDECMDVLAAEKPLWSQTFAPCHPMGAVAEFTIPLPAGMETEGQFAFLNGGSDGTLEDERSINLGLLLRTPREELSLSGFYNPAREATGEFDLETWDPIHEDGYRFGFGVDYAGEALLFRSEYYRGRAFGSCDGMGALPIDPSIAPGDREMEAFYAETGYRLSTGREALPAVLPYVRYQYWDRFSNSAGDYGISYITAGITLELAESGGSLRVDYETPIDTPEEILGETVEEEASRFLVRLQTGY